MSTTKLILNFPLAKRVMFKFVLYDVLSRREPKANFKTIVRFGLIFVSQLFNSRKLPMLFTFLFLSVSSISLKSLMVDKKLVTAYFWLFDCRRFFRGERVFTFSLITFTGVIRITRKRKLSLGICDRFLISFLNGPDVGVSISQSYSV